MMIAVYLAAGVAAVPATDPTAGIADPATRQLASLCELALAAKAGGSLEWINVESVRRKNSRTTLSGRIQVFQRAAPPSAGELSPDHVINAHYTYKCHLHGRNVGWVTLRKP